MQTDGPKMHGSLHMPDPTRDASPAGYGRGTPSRVPIFA